MQDLKGDCARRKAARLAGKTRSKRPRQVMSEERQRKLFTPKQRFRPANDGTRSGVPNGLPDSYIKYPNDRSPRTLQLVAALRRKEDLRRK